MDEQSQLQSILIPGLPNDISSLIIAFIPYPHHSRLKSTSKSWNSFLSSKTLINLRNTQIPKSQLSHLICIFPQDPSTSPPFLFDPQTLAWKSLPLTPCNPNTYGLCNFMSVSVNSHLYLLGGSLFDTRSYPIDRPTPSSSVFRYDILCNSGLKSWESLSPMISPRGSFACVVLSDSGRILVAGGGSRHTCFGAAGTRLNSVEMYDIEKDEWVTLDQLPQCRAGCTGFFVNGEVWVMGGYGESLIVAEMFPVDQYYMDTVVMKMKNGGKWEGVVWDRPGNGEARIGKIVAVDDGKSGFSSIFMLDGSDIVRYDMTFKRWNKESSVPRRASKDSEFGFVALKGELHVMNLLKGVDQPETRRPGRHKKAATLFIQIYHPAKKTWRSIVTKPPCNDPLNFKTAVMCTIRA